MSSASHCITKNPTSIVVPIGRHRGVFPAGTEARHCERGWVLVERVEDNRRLIRWCEFREVPAAELLGRIGEQGDPVVEELEVVSHRQWVDIIDLRRIVDPERSRPAHWQRLKRVGALRLPLGDAGRDDPVPTAHRATAVHRGQQGAQP